MASIKNYTLRIPEDMLKKYHYVVKYNGRSVNAQLLQYIRKSIEAFEAEHGEIPESQE